MFKRRPYRENVPGQRKTTEFLKAGKLADVVRNYNSRELINDTHILKNYPLPIRPIKIGKQLVRKIAIEDIQTKTAMQTEVLVDSGCMKTCIDKEYARKEGLMFIKILNPIKVEYTDGMTIEGSTI
jgi:hypothetical protein